MTSCDEEFEFEDEVTEFDRTFIDDTNVDPEFFVPDDDYVPGSSVELHTDVKEKED